jgi:hypothetical protein
MRSGMKKRDRTMAESIVDGKCAPRAGGLQPPRKPNAAENAKRLKSLRRQLRPFTLVAAMKIQRRLQTDPDPTTQIATLAHPSRSGNPNATRRPAVSREETKGAKERRSSSARKATEDFHFALLRIPFASFATFARPRTIAAAARLRHGTRCFPSAWLPFRFCA